jgi:hypothetical protein
MTKPGMMMFAPVPTWTRVGIFSKWVTILVSIIFLAACAHVDVTKAGKGFYDPTNAADVGILKTKPDRHFEELGTVTVTGFDADEAAKMHNAIREKSAALGANAVILTEEGLVQAGFGYKRWATGVAIRFATTAP